ncbi:MAG: hypothetical protein R8G34_12240 [Paracoccaceae bacterium]|nr:hypothetical protein [Paracoccaceae bacterium]
MDRGIDSLLTRSEDLGAADHKPIRATEQKDFVIFFWCVCLGSVIGLNRNLKQAVCVDLSGQTHVDVWGKTSRLANTIAGKPFSKGGEGNSKSLSSANRQDFA